MMIFVHRRDVEPTSRSMGAGCLAFAMYLAFLKSSQKHIKHAPQVTSGARGRIFGEASHHTCHNRATMLTCRAVRLASRRIVSTRTFASAAQVAVKNDSSARQLAPLLAAAGLAVAGTALYREVGHESNF